MSLSFGVIRWSVCGGSGVWSLKDGVEGEVLLNRFDKNGKINSRRRGRNCERDATPGGVWEGSGSFVSLGRLRGRFPPN